MIKLLLLDVDGTLTDGKINISANGEMFKSFDIKDGFALYGLMPKAGITPVIITGRESKITEFRCRELGIFEFYQGVSDKLTKIIEITSQHNCDLGECAYIGDDINDYAAMSLCGFRACPINAIDEIKSMADYVSSLPAGFGAVRDICDYILRMQGKYADVYKSYGLEE